MDKRCWDGTGSRLLLTKAAATVPAERPCSANFVAAAGRIARSRVRAFTHLSFTAAVTRPRCPADPTRVNSVVVDSQILVAIEVPSRM